MGIFDSARADNSAVDEAEGQLPNQAAEDAPGTNGEYPDFGQGTEAGLKGANPTAATLPGHYSLTQAASQAFPYTSQYAAAMNMPADRGISNAFQQQGNAGYVNQQQARDLQLQAYYGMQGNSVAQQQLAQGIQQAQMAQASAAAGARGGGANLAAAQRLGAQQSAMLGAQGNQQSAMLRAQEQQQLGQYAAGIRSQDQAGMNAAYQNQMAGLNMNAQNKLAYANLMNQGAVTQLQANISRDQLRENTNLSNLNRGAAAYEGSQNRTMQYVGAGAAAAGAILSDRRLKTEIRDGTQDVEAALDKLSPFSYRYRDQSHGSGDRPGIMAQDLERSPAGRDAVVETREGKAVDVNRGLSLALAAAANINRRLRKLEGR